MIHAVIPSDGINSLHVMHVTRSTSSYEIHKVLNVKYDRVESI
ncbi:hypothetical protein DYY67_2004 [Candidatus Nitrosotalea sp. TS]|nr:hypothetical protein [Candidatus Nitrosotalea sp. TS]NHI02322.1 hypothetical protein [Candidatus Nitrosotalea sp. TS]